MDMTGNRQKTTKSPRASAPNFAQRLSDAETKLGQTLVLECRVDGYPRPEVHWEKDGKLLGKSRNIHTTRCGETCTLELRNVRETDLGVYQCVALNILGTTRTQSHIYLPGKPIKATAQEKVSRTLRVPGSSSNRSRSAERESLRSVQRSPSSPGRLKDYEERLRLLRSQHAMASGLSNRRWDTGTQEPERVRKTNKNTGKNNPTRSYADKNHSPSNFRPDCINYKSGERLHTAVRTSKSAVEQSVGHNGSLNLSQPSKSRISSRETNSPKLLRKAKGSPDLTRDKNTKDVSRALVEPVKLLKEVAQKMYKKVPSQKMSITKSEHSPTARGNKKLNSANKINGIAHLNNAIPTIIADDHSINSMVDHDHEIPKTVNGDVTSNSERSFPMNINCGNIEIIGDVYCVSVAKDPTEGPTFGVNETEILDKILEPTLEELNQHRKVSVFDGVPEGRSTEGSEITLSKPLPEITVQNDENEDECDNLLKNCTCTCHVPERILPQFNEPVTVNIRYSSMPEDTYEEFPSKPSPSDVRVSYGLQSVNSTDEGLHRAIQMTPFSTPSKIVKGPVSVTVRSGDRVTLKTSFIGTPPNKVTWMRGGTILTHGGQYSIKTEDFESEMTIHSVTADDSGKYIATVENDHGGDSCFASVAVLGFPKPPSGPPTASDFTAHSLVLSWYGSMFDGGSVLTGYVVEMCRIPGRQWQIVATCVDTSCVVDGLSLGQRYLFRVRAKNRYGQGEPSRETQTICLDEYLSKQADENDDLPTHSLTIQQFSEFMDRYDLKEEVGRGKFGKVHRCIDKWSGLPRAAKIIRCRKSRDRSDVGREIEVMKKLRHPKLLRLVGAFESEKIMVMVTEFISGGELFQRVIMDDFVLTESDCILFMRQICDGVSYMHRCSVLHLDLKPENILCKTRTSHQIKIIDFGLSTFYNPNESLCILFGTPEFVAPEVIAFEPVGPPSDMWSVGVICYVLLSGLSPFLGDSESETFANITRGEIDFDEEEFDNISKDAKKFISDIVVKNPRRRLSAAECLNHSWLKRAYWLEDYPPLSTEKLKKFIIRRKWQKSGTAIRALRRFVTLSRSSAESFGDLDSPQTPASPAPTDTSEDSGVFHESNGFDFSK